MPTTPRKRPAVLWRRCRAIGGTHAEAYLHARGGSRIAPSRRCAFIPNCSTATAPACVRLPALVAAITLRAALNEARAFLALPASPGTGDADTYDASEAARRLWRRCRAIGGTHAEAYLHARGLMHCSFPALRYHPELFYRDGTGMRRLPALVAAITGNDGVLTGVQRTWLDPRTPAKAEVAHPRKALARIHGLAVRFGNIPADSVATLLVGEGIETVLSMITAVPSIAAAAALSAGSLGAFAPPTGITRLVIARDNDSEGERAAERLARGCAQVGIEADVIVPERGDFNDDLVALGASALAARIAPLFPDMARIRAPVEKE